MGKFDISEYNRLPEVIETLSFPDRVFIVDSTIRSLQSGVSGSRHTVKDLVEIGKALDELGVRELIVNPCWADDGVEIIEGLAKENLHSKIVSVANPHYRNWEKYADDAVRAGADEINVEQIRNTEVLKRAADLIQSQGKTVSHAFSRLTSYQEVVDICRESVKYGYQSQSFQDSFFRRAIGPEGIKFLVKSLRADVPQCPPIYIHLSDFFGHSTMTAVAALAAGASAVDVCMNAIGHHCGHISLAEVVITLEGLYGIDTGIKLAKLREVSLLIRERTGIPLPITEPVVGDFAFVRDGAMAYRAADLVAAEGKESSAAEFPFPPSTVGAEERVIWSNNTITPVSVRAKLASMGLAYEEGDIEHIIDRLGEVLREKREYPNWMLESDFEELCRAVIRRGGTSKADKDGG